jgi:hypothetical protein
MAAQVQADAIKFTTDTLSRSGVILAVRMIHLSGLRSRKAYTTAFKTPDCAQQPIRGPSA